jgi:hypothetical protein
MQPISAIFGGVGCVRILCTFMGAGVNVDFSYICPFGCRAITQLV